MFKLSVSPPRCHIVGLRIHHALTGMAISAVGIYRGSRSLFVIGFLLTLQDFHDHPWSLFDH